ncbi:MAG: alpha/beta fold hydrolase [Saprospiraceae bacterium]|nr:alpha/beta fold hydrolase [Saprospiraceae bacterium]
MTSIQKLIPASKKWRWLMALTLLLAVGLFYGFTKLPYIGIKPFRWNPDENMSGGWRFPKGAKPSNYGLKAQKISIKTPDGIQLSAWLCESNLDSTRGAVIVLHGISSCKETQFSRAALLANQGFAVLIPDLRAHGESGGDFCTFGFYEKYDMKAALDTLTALFPNKKMGIWGASLGGAITIQSVALDSRFDFGIVESTFDDFRLVANEYSASYVGFKNQDFTDYILSKSEEIAHFEADSVKPYLAAATIHQPMLFMHGSKDERIPIEMGRHNFEACASPNKQWITVENGFHTNLWTIQYDSLSSAVTHFLNDKR